MPSAGCGLVGVSPRLHFLSPVLSLRLSRFLTRRRPLCSAGMAAAVLATAESLAAAETASQLSRGYSRCCSGCYLLVVGWFSCAAGDGGGGGSNGC